jgi:hypothetical protein
MPRVTISYRRDDSLDITGRIFDRLAGHFGREAVFRDIDNIPPGADFRRHIDRVLNDSDIVLAIVGPRWIGPDDEQRRLASPADPVRLEIETALRLKKPLIPVLVSHAVMPHSDALPDSLNDFAYHNAVQIDSGQDFEVHVGRLIRAMERILRIDEEREADGTNHGVTATIETAPSMEMPKAEPPVAWVVPPGGRIVAVNRNVRWAIGLGVVVMLGAIGGGSWWVFVEQPAEMARLEGPAAAKSRAEEQGGEAAAAKAQQEEQARQTAAAKAQAEDALRKGKAALNTKDYPEAMRWFRKAADLGNTDAWDNIGLMYRNGWRVPKDYGDTVLKQAGNAVKPSASNNTEAQSAVLTSPLVPPPSVSPSVAPYLPSPVPPAMHGSNTDAAPSVDSRDLARQLQTELHRVGCYFGGINGNWGRPASEALQHFNKMAGTKLNARVASVESIAAVRERTGRVCPPVLRARPQARR